jgi:hypothetical protein
MILEQHEPNVHVIKLEGNKCRIAMLSDIHWDNPKCDWKLLKSHLDYCLEHSIPIHINGDFYCVMAGKYDFRSSKSGIRPMHNVDNYLDSLIDTSVEWFKPYAHLIALVSYGNHETAIQKRHETDLIERFASKMNLSEGTNIQVGGYGGWLVVELNDNGVRCPFRIKYHHGLSKGASVVTKGAIDLTRSMGITESMDVFTQGHIHQSMSRNDVREKLISLPKSGYRIAVQKIHHMITGTYKEEYFGTGGMGWHYSRGAEARNLGGRIMTLSFKRVWNGKSSKQKDKRNIVKHVDSCLFPVL